MILINPRLVCYDKMYDGVINYYIISGILKGASRAAAYQDLGGKYKTCLSTLVDCKHFYINYAICMLLTNVLSHINRCWLFALKHPYLPPNSSSGICAVVSKYKERWCITICIKSYFN